MDSKNEDVGILGGGKHYSVYYTLKHFLESQNRLPTTLDSIKHADPVVAHGQPLRCEECHIVPNE